MTPDLTAQKVPGDWLCKTGFAYRETYNAEQRANGTSLSRGIPPSRAEREASARYSDHIETCAVCRA
jgi:hypothetical protein